MDAVFGRELTQRAGRTENRLPVLFVSRPEGREQRHGAMSQQVRFRDAGRSGPVHDGRSRNGPRRRRMRNAGRGHQGRILPQPPGIGRNPRREQFGERPDAAQQREGGLRGDFRIEKPVAPEGELPGRKARRIGDVQRGKAQAADILPPEVFGEIVIGGLGTRQRAERRQAHAVVQAAGCAVEAHRIGNGAVADSMRFYGAPCGLNYGVSLPTLRTLARAEAADHDFAKYLWRQDVRCLRLAALHIADPARLTPGEFAFWGDGLLNSEIAAEAAFALLSRIGAFPELFAAWIAPDAGWLRQYAALMAAARVPHPSPAWAVPAAAVVHGAAAASIPEAHLLAHGAVALFTALGTRNEENRQAVLRAAGSLGQLPAEDCVHEELAWRLEV